MSLKPLRLLSTFCWYSLWGLRRPHVFLFLFFWVLNCRKHLNPFPFWQQAAVWAPASPFPFEVLPCSHPAGRLQNPLASSLSPLSPPLCLFLQNPQQNVILWFFFVLFLCFCLEFFPFLLRLCPEKTSFACFLLFLHTFLYITFTSLFSIVCAKTDRFKRVSKKLF